MTKISFTRAITKNWHGCLKNKEHVMADLASAVKLATHQMWLRHIPLVCSTCQPKKPKPMYAPIPCPASSSPTTYVQFAFKILTKLGKKFDVGTMIVSAKDISFYNLDIQISRLGSVVQLIRVIQSSTYYIHIFKIIQNTNLHHLISIR